MSILGFTPAVAAGSAYEPQDYGIFGDDESITGRVIVTPDGYSQILSAASGCFDPRWTANHFVAGLGGLNGSVTTGTGGGCAFPNGGNPTPETWPDVGYSGVDGALRFGAVADPDNPARKAFLYRMRQGDGTDSTGSHRVEISLGNTYIPTPKLWRGRRFMSAFSVRIPEAWRSIVPPDEHLLWQIHDTGDVGDDAAQNPNVSLIQFGGPGGDPSQSRLSWMFRTSADPVTRKADYINTRYDDFDWPGDTWIHYAMDMVMHWDASQGPYFRIWRALGDSGPIELFVDHTGPNQYNNVQDDYVKCGLYYYANAYSAGITDRVVHNKGLHLWRYKPGMTPERLIAFSRGI